MSKVAIQGDSSGSGTFTIASPNSNNNRTLTLPDNTGTVLTTGSTFAGTGPAFRAFLGSNQTLTINVTTVMVFDTKAFDTNSRYNATGSTVGGIPAYSFLPNVAGYYYIHSTLGFSGANPSVTGSLTLTLSVNGGATAFQLGRATVASDFPFPNGSVIIYLNGTSDYVTMTATQNATASGLIQGGAQFSVFEATLIRAA